MKKNESKIKVLELLKQNGQWMTPTQVGEALGKPYGNASSFATPKLRKLEAEGLVERNSKGHAKIKEV